MPRLREEAQPPATPGEGSKARRSAPQPFGRLGPLPPLLFLSLHFWPDGLPPALFRMNLSQFSIGPSSKLMPHAHTLTDVYRSLRRLAIDEEMREVVQSEVEGWIPAADIHSTG